MNISDIQSPEELKNLEHTFVTLRDRVTGQLRDKPCELIDVDLALGTVSVMMNREKELWRVIGVSRFLKRMQVIPIPYEQSCIEKPVKMQVLFTPIPQVSLGK